MNVILILVVFLLVFGLVVSGFVIGLGTIAAKHRWNFKLSLAIAFFIPFFLFSLLIWLGVRETWIIILGTSFSLVTGFGVYMWPSSLIDRMKVAFNKLAHVEN